MGASSVAAPDHEAAVTSEASSGSAKNRKGRSGQKGKSKPSVVSDPSESAPLTAAAAVLPAVMQDVDAPTPTRTASAAAAVHPTPKKVSAVGVFLYTTC